CALRRPSVPAGAAGAATQRAQLEVGIETRMLVDPRHAQPPVGARDLGRPRHLRGQPILERGALAASAIESQALERIDGAMPVGPVDAERIAPDQVHVLRDTWIGLADDPKTAGLLHVPPPIAGRERRMPAS